MFRFLKTQNHHFGTQLEKMMKKCDHCKQYKEDESFAWRWKTLGIRQKTCRDCRKYFNKNWYEGDARQRHLKNVKERKHAARKVAREYVWNYLSTHPCSQCGETDPVVLEFHHNGGKERAVGVMAAGGYPVAKIQAEIDKCTVLCANCHRRLTMKERKWYRGTR